MLVLPVIAGFGAVKLQDWCEQSDIPVFGVGYSFWCAIILICLQLQVQVLKQPQNRLEQGSQSPDKDYFSIDMPYWRSIQVISSWPRDFLQRIFVSERIACSLPRNVLFAVILAQIRLEQPLQGLKQPYQRLKQPPLGLVEPCRGSYQSIIQPRQGLKECCIEPRQGRIECTILVKRMGFRGKECGYKPSKIPTSSPIRAKLQ